jgi:hypothetical protein
MKPGNETWKWGLVFLLLAVFIAVANQAYVHVTSQEDFAPPDDYLKGDSWDIEHGSGPGAGQPMQITPQDLTNQEEELTEQIDSSLTNEPDQEPREEVDWDKVDDIPQD